MTKAKLRPEAVEAFAIRCALGNNGGQWATHYTKDQKTHWRRFVRDLADEVAGKAISEAMRYRDDNAC